MSSLSFVPRAPSLPVIPSEVWRTIVRAATSVPDAFNTRLSTDINEGQIGVWIAVEQSFGCKYAISLVSRYFHELVEEFLYETIIIHKLSHIRPLVRLLREERPFRPTRGWWCRRLDVHLDNEGGWESGNSTFWGLLPACPRVIDLRWTVFPGARGAGLYANFDVSAALLVNLSISHGSRLKRLELMGNLRIDCDLAGRFLSFTPELEICRLGRLLAENSEVDSENGTLRDEDEEDWEFVEACNTAHWPSPIPEAVKLPRLHTLDITPISNSISSWALPSLQAVRATLAGPQDPQTHLEGLRTCLADHLSHVIFFTHGGNHRIDLWGVVQLFPRLQQISYRIYEAYEDEDDNPPIQLASPHKHLRTVILYRLRFQPDGIVAPLDDIYSVALSGRLPSLTAVKAWGDDVGEGHINSRRESFMEIKVDLETEYRPFHG